MPTPAYRLTGTGLQIARELSRNEWLEIGGKLIGYAVAIQWAIGDWVIYGETRHWGATNLFTEAQWKTKKSYESILQSANVARAFPPEHRKLDLSWSHYREALRLPDEDRLPMLREAVKEHWSKKTFAQEISDRMRIEIGDLMADGRIRRTWPARAKATHVEKPTITCPHCGHKWVTTRQLAHGDALVPAELAAAETAETTQSRSETAPAAAEKPYLPTSRVSHLPGAERYVS